MEDNSLKYESGPFLQFHCKTITDFVQRMSEKELGETKEKRKECLSALRKLIERERNLDACISEDFLLQFLRAKKFDIESAFGLLKRYYAHILEYPDLHEITSLSLKEKLVQSNFANFLPHRSPEGCAIWTVRVGLWDPKDIAIEETIAFGLMCQKLALMNPVTQICGFVSIVDLSGLSWSQIFSTTPDSLRGFIRAIQDSLPIRQKAIHVINHPSIFRFLFAIIKPLLSLKMQKRIHFHDDERSLFEFLPPEILPKEFGGTLETFESKEFLNSVLKSDSNFEKL